MTYGLSARKLETLCLIVLSASFAFHLSATGRHIDPGLALTLTPMRLDGVVLGAWLALGLRRNRRSSSLLDSHRSRIAAAAVLAVLLLLPARGLPARHPWVLAVGPSGLALIFGLFLSGLLISPKGSLVRRL